MHFCRCAIAFVAVIAGAQWARAELFILANDGQIRGELVNKTEVPRKHYIIRTEQGEVTLDRAQVVKVVRESPAQVEYEKIRPGYPDTVQGQWELAEWCREHHLSVARKTHLQRVIELDPENAEGRRALGYGRIEGRWVTQDQIMTERGYKQYKGKWMLPQEIELLERDRKTELAQKEWFQKLKRWRGWLDDADKSEQAQAQIAAIDDPFALKAISEGFKNEANDQVRLLYVAALGRMATPGALEFLVHRSLEDPVEEVRLSCLDVLVEHQHPDMTTMFVKGLKHKENVMVNRAALGLARFKDPSSIGPLIDALITTHKHKIVNGSGGTSASFSPNGGPGGLSMGSSTRVITEHLPNETVRDALIGLTGANYNYDEKAWKSWFAARKKDQYQGGRRD